MRITIQQKSWLNCLCLAENGERDLKNPLIVEYNYFGKVKIFSALFVVAASLKIYISRSSQTSRNRTAESGAQFWQTL